VNYLPRAWLDLRKSSEFSSPNTGWFSPLSLLPSPSLSLILLKLLHFVWKKWLLLSLLLL
jgi:hypothetical protein